MANLLEKMSMQLILKLEEKVINIITKGKNSMPKYSKSFSESEIKAISAYVMTLRVSK